MTDPEELAARVRDGDVRIHELEDHADYDTAVEARRLLVERETGADLEAVGDYSFPAEQAEPNIENMIGAAQVPTL
ncbi:MAG: 3-hydroxy-3-methylglutaryl-CoA reductase, partial [Natrinema limicola]